MTTTLSNPMWRPLIDHVFETRSHLDPHIVELEQKYRQVSDVEGRDLIRAIKAGRIDRAEIERLLVTGDPVPAGAPEELKRFFAHIDDVGSVVDLAAAKRGAEVLMSIPPTLLWANAIVLGAIYPSSDVRVAMPGSINKKVMENSASRFAETAMYFRDMMVHGGYTRPGLGVATSTRVRMVHCFVADVLNNDPDWPHELYGAPVPTSATVWVGYVFGVMALEYGQQHGLQFTAQEKEDVAAYSAVTGYLMGGPAELISEISSYDTAVSFVRAYIETTPVPREKDYERLRGVVGGFYGTGGFPISRNPVLSKLFNRHLASQVRTAFGARAADTFGVPANDAWSIAGNLMLGSLNTALTTGARLPIAKNQVRAVSKKFWVESVPGIYEKLTGKKVAMFDDVVRTA